MKSNIGLYIMQASSILEALSIHSMMALLTAIILSWKERFLNYTIPNGSSYKLKYIYLSCKAVTFIK